MSEWKIYHNPRCSKSRQTLELLKEKGIEPQIIEYLDETPSVNELKDIVKKLALQPKELLRTKESIFEEIDVDIEDEAAVLKAMNKYPKLIERPIVVKDNRAVLGRPPENINELF